MAKKTNSKLAPLELKIVGIAGENIAAYMGVKLDTGVVKSSTVAEGESILGITDKAYTTGQNVAVIKRGESYAIVATGQTIDVHDAVAVADTGTIKVASTAGADVPIGVCIKSGTAADIILIDVVPTS